MGDGGCDPLANGHQESIERISGMKNRSQIGCREYTRRSFVGRAAVMGGGAALSAAVPSLLIQGKYAEGEVSQVPKREVAALSAAASGDSTTNTAKFSKEFLSNKAFQDWALTFEAPGAQSIEEKPGGKTIQTGAVIQPNGDIQFRIFAPKATEVKLKFTLVRTGELVLEKRDDGVFEGVLPYDDEHSGPMSVDVYIDGMAFIYPYLPIHWSAGYPHNFVEVPESDLDFLLIKDVPHGGITREIFWAEAGQSWERCFVYTPPGYAKSTSAYPVLYLQHGAGENEVVWDHCGKVAYILDNLLAEKKIVPFIVVMNNNGIRDPNASGQGFGTGDPIFERVLLESCIPFIEKNHRVKSTKWDRALAGLSMGSFQSCDIGFRHPELFGSIGTFTASMTRVGEENNTRPYKTVMKDPENPGKFGKNYRVYFRSTTPKEDRFETFLADDKICADAGVDKLPCYHRVLYSKRTTKWNSWRMGLRDYSQLIFK